MPYRIQRSGSQYAVVDDKGKTVGTHPTKSKATEQVRALYANVVEAGKNNAIRYGRRRSGVGDSHSGMNTGGMTMTAADQIEELSSVVKDIISEISGTKEQIVKAMPNLKEGDFAMTAHGGDEEFHIGQVVHVMREGMLGIPGGEYTLEATPENPAVLIQLFEQDEDGLWEATRTYSACTMSLFIAIDPLPVEPELTVEDVPNMNSQPDLMDAYDASIGKSECCPEDISKQAPCWEGYVQRGMKPGEGGKMVPNCVPAEKADDLWEDDDTVVYEDESVSKAEGYSPPAGARSAAKRAIKFKEDGKANGAGTAVGWTRAGQLARGESLSLSTVKRMYSYFSRHEVDKKGKDWGNTANPSNGYIMWLAWGGDAGFSWSRSIVEREKKKSDRVWANSPFNIKKG
jgi:hypothetical protein